MDVVQESVYELYGFLCAEFSGNLQRFVDHNHGRSFLVVADFVDSQSQNIPIDHGHALQTPMLGMMADQEVDLLHRFHRACEQMVGKGAEGLGLVARWGFLGVCLGFYQSFELCFFLGR